MNLKIKTYLNLLWRIVGANAILIIIAIMCVRINPEISMQMIIGNLMYILFTIYRVIKEDLSMKSKCFQVLIIFAIYKLVSILLLANDKSKCILATLSIIFEGIWITKYYVAVKAKRGN